MDFDKIFTILSSHWPFLAVALILAVIGEVIKGIVIGNEDIKKTEYKGLKKLYVKTLALHPIATGALWGLLLSTTIPDVVLTGGVVSSVLYFALSGALSSTLYSLFKAAAPMLVSLLRSKIAGLAGKAPAEPVAPKEPEDGV